MQTVDKKASSLTVRDLITIGIFTALFLVLFMVGGSFFAMNPALTFYMPVGGVLLPGPVYMLLLAKTPKRSTAAVLGIIMGILMFVTGMHWSMALGFAVLGVVADLIAGAGGYRNIKLNILSYILLCTSTLGPYLAFFFTRESYITYMLEKGNDPAYMETMSASGQMWILPVMVIGNLVVSCLGGMLGSRLLRRQFRKAGAVQ